MATQKKTTDMVGNSNVPSIDTSAGVVATPLLQANQPLIVRSQFSNNNTAVPVTRSPSTSPVAVGGHEKQGSADSLGSFGRSPKIGPKKVPNTPGQYAQRPVALGMRGTTVPVDGFYPTNTTINNAATSSGEAIVSPGLPFTVDAGLPFEGISVLPPTAQQHCALDRMDEQQQGVKRRSVDEMSVPDSKPSTPVNNSHRDESPGATSNTPAVTSLIPQPLPTSALLYVLTASEGRDKSFKLLQYLLKFAISVLHIRNLFPVDADHFSVYWSARLSQNVQTVRNGRSMFKLGRWIITAMHLQECLETLLECRRQDMAEAEERRLREQAAAAEAKRRIEEAACAPAVRQEHEKQPPGNRRQSLMGHSTRLPHHRHVGFRTPYENNEENNTTQETETNNKPDTSINIKNNDDTTVEEESALGDGSIRFSDTGKPVVFQPPEDALPRNWRRTALSDLPRWGLLLIALRCALSIIRNISRDLMFLGDKELLGFRSAKGALYGFGGVVVVERRSTLQSLANKAWLIVALCDVALNFYRLFDKGWIAMSMTPENKVYCQCNLLVLTDSKGTCNNREGTLSVETDPFFVRRKPTMSFPPLDLDYGSVTPTTAAFFEAAPPARMKPCCNVCGCLLQHVPTNSTTAVSHAHQNQSRQFMYIPFIIRRCYSLLWCATNHSNFFYTVLLQARYLADLFLAAGYVFGDYEPITEWSSGELVPAVGDTSALAKAAATGAGKRVAVAAAQPQSIAQHNHMLGAVAGIVSSSVALWRVVKSAS